MSLTAEQLAIRKTGIASSEVAAILGASPWQRPIDVFLRKIGEAPEQPESAAMEWGSRLEPLIAEKYYAVRSVNLIKGVTLRHPKHPMVITTPDYVVIPKCLEHQSLLAESASLIQRSVKHGGIPVEIKTARSDDDWKDPAEQIDGIPDYYRVQVEVQMAVLNAPKADVAVLFGGSDFRIYTLTADTDLQEMLIEAIHRFWTRHVLTKEPPPPDASESYRDYLAKRYPKPKGDLLTASGDTLLWLEELASRKQIIAKAEREKAQLENRLKTVIGDAAGLIAPDGSKLTWNHRKGYVRPAVEIEAGRQLRCSGPLFKGDVE